MNKLKSGDKVICIKNRINLRNNSFNHIKGQIYIIINYSTLNNNDTELEYYKVTGEINSTHFGLSNFDKYFVTLKQLRQQKLQKLYPNEPSL